MRLKNAMLQEPGADLRQRMRDVQREIGLRNIWERKSYWERREMWGPTR